MSSYTEMEQYEFARQRHQEKMDNECVTCKTCGSQWFEEIEINRYKLDHHVVVGQPVPSKPGAIPFIMLKCVRCSGLIEPRVISATRDIAGGDAYNDFLDTLEGKGDKREAKEPGSPDAVPSEEL